MNGFQWRIAKLNLLNENTFIEEIKSVFETHFLISGALFSWNSHSIDKSSKDSALTTTIEAQSRSSARRLVSLRRLQSRVRARQRRTVNLCSNVESLVLPSALRSEPDGRRPKTLLVRARTDGTAAVPLQRRLHVLLEAALGARVGLQLLRAALRGCAAAASEVVDSGTDQLGGQSGQRGATHSQVFKETFKGLQSASKKFIIRKPFID